MATTGSKRRFGVSAEKQAALEARLARLGVRESDLQERFQRAQGPGGQNVNKVATAVRLRHLPSGVEVRAQQGRSQAQNRFFARRMLADRLEMQTQGSQAPAARLHEKRRRQKQRRQRRARTKIAAPAATGTLPEAPDEADADDAG